jgi:hypothetical protein
MSVRSSRPRRLPDSEYVPWNLLAKISVGLPVVGTGVKKALCISDP